MILFTFLFSALLFLIQRAEARRRLLVAAMLGPLILLVLWFANTRGQGGEAVAALILALLLNFLFWLLIGRYNPVGSSDDIRVIGLDD